MITYEKACEIAREIKQEQCPSFKSSDVVEVADRWAFIFNPDAETVMTPPPSFFVFKEDGRVAWFSIPPLENLDLLNSGKDVAFIE